MDKHVDALGYLLAAVVFSVGFLSNRIHANLDSTIKAIGDRSWQMRQAINEGGRLGPEDLTDLFAVIRRSRDYVAVGSRVLNWTIFVIICIVFGDAVRLTESGAATHAHELFVMGLLFAASFAVVVFSEFDVRRVALEQQSEIAATTLGRMQRLAQLLERADTRRASSAITRLRDTYPTWGLLDELDAYVALLRGQPQQGLGRINALLDGSGDLYLSSVVGAACCLEIAGLDAALELLSRVEQRGIAVRHTNTLHHALAVAAGHLTALLGEPRAHPDTEHSSHSLALSLLGQELERRREPVRALALDLSPTNVRQLAPLVTLVDLWEHSDELSDFGTGGILPSLLQLVLTPSHQPTVAATLEAHSERCHNAQTLESFGLVALAFGESRTALRYFESAIRIAPASARCHWGRAIACHRVGWHDAAADSLQRVDTLSQDEPLLSLTRRVLDEHAGPVDPGQVLSSYPNGVNDLDRFELSLLGVDVVQHDGKKLRQRFAIELISKALANVST